MAMKKNNDYWQRRTLQLENALHNKGVKYYHDLERQYRKAANETQKEINKLYTRLASENNISLSEAKKLLTTNELEEFRWSVQDYIKYGQKNAVDPSWIKQLENASLRYRISRLEAMKIQMQNQVEVLMGNELDSFSKVMSDIYTEGYYRNAHLIQTGLGVGSNLAVIDAKRIEKVLSKPWVKDGKNFSERIWGTHRPQLINELHTQLTQSIIRGQAPDKAINAIAKRFDVAKNRAGNLVMTESAYFGNVAQQDCYKELDVEMQEFVATLDLKTSDICRSMDGKVFKSSEVEIGLNAPPLHCRCRSVMVPYFADNITERAARGEDGKTVMIDGNMKYNDWFKQFVEGEDVTATVATATNLFKPAESIQEAEQFARDSGVENVSFKNIDLEVANGMNESLAEHFRDFPELKKNIHFWGSAQEKKNFLGDVVRKHFENLYKPYRDTFGSKYMDKKIKSKVTSYFKTSGEWAHAFDHRKYFENEMFSGIAINKKYGSDLALFKSGLKSSLDAKFHPVACDTVKSVFDHEFGHQLDYLLKISDNDEFLKIYRNGVNGKHVTTQNLSKYAVNSTNAIRNKKETIAEAWAEYRNNPEPRDIAKAIGELIEKEYERKFRL